MADNEPAITSEQLREDSIAAAKAANPNASDQDIEAHIPS